MKTDCKKKEQNIQKLWDTTVIEIPEKEEREKGIKEIFKIIINIPKLMPDTTPQCQGAQRIPSRINAPQKTTYRHKL